MQFHPVILPTSEEDDELKREDDGAYTDDEVSYDNDSVAKLLGQSRRTAKQRRKFAQRERQRMAERVVSLTEKLHLDNVEIVTRNWKFDFYISRNLISLILK